MRRRSLLRFRTLPRLSPASSAASGQGGNGHCRCQKECHCFFHTFAPFLSSFCGPPVSAASVSSQSIDFLIPVAGQKVARRHLGQVLGRLTAFRRIPAALGKAAARRRVHRGGYLPFQDDPFLLLMDIGNRDRGEQRLRVRMQRIFKQLLGRLFSTICPMYITQISSEM